MGHYPREVRERFLGTPEQNASGLVGERPRRWSTIVVVEPDPGWPQRYAAARAGIVGALGERVVSIEHVGSTSVPGLAAKPIVDIDLVLQDTADEASYVPALEPLGYRLVLREPWWHGHRMLVGGDEDINLHVWPRGAPEPVRHRLFRDWLRAHPEDRELYDSLDAPIRRGEPVDAQYRLLGFDGRTRWVEVHERARRSGEGRIVVDGVVSDITRRKETEDTREVFLAPNGVALDKEEKERADRTFSGIDYSRGGRGTRA